MERADIFAEDDWLPWIDRFLTANPGPVVLGLSGELGAGKTTLVRNFVKRLHRTPEKAPRVVSPTYVFHQNYADLSRPVEHFDLYRLEAATTGMLEELGYYEAVARTQRTGGLMFVEWPEKAKDPAILALTHHVTIALSSEKHRSVLIQTMEQQKK